MSQALSTVTAPDALPDRGAGGTLTTDFAGRPEDLFRLSLKTGALTVLTLGFYRFWMKTRLRRWYWSAVRPGGIGLEYTGLPAEKLLGFLIAVVILAFYIGVVNLILMFASYALLAQNGAAYAISLAGVVPLWFFARYRARRYVLARTRWRGIRFGMQPGAWGYAGRALVHWAVTILTLGALWPRMTFALEKYRTDRTFYGSARLTQGGRWQMLMPQFVHALTGGGLSALSALVAYLDHPSFGWLLTLTIPWLGYGVCHYIAGSTRVMADHKTAEGISLVSAIRPQRVARIYLFGTLGAAGIIAAPLVVLGLSALAVETNRAALAAIPSWAFALVGAMVYFAVFLAWATLRHVFVLMPLWRHYAETLTVRGAEAVGTVRQRTPDGSTEAEGFAEALDVGAAI